MAVKADKRKIQEKGEKGSPVARGSTVMATLEFLSAEIGAAAAQRVLAVLSSEDRMQIAAVVATDEVPLALPSRLWRAVQEQIGEEDPGWVERAGAFSIELRGVQSYGGILRKTTPAEFLTQQVSLFKLYYRGGDMVVVEQHNNRAILRLIGLESDERDGLFCRRQTGGLERALTIAGGKGARVRHVRCAVEGDAYCEWDVRWE